MKLSYNICINGLNTLLNICFPALTLPLAARALGPDTLGSVNLIVSLTTTCTGISNLGISIFAIVTIARLHTRAEQAQTFYNLIFLQIIGAFAGWLVYQLLVWFYGGWQHHILLFQLGGLSIFLSFLTSEWFFIGRMNFLFMTGRNVCIKLVVLGLIVFLIRSPDDVTLYMITLLIGLNGSQLINFLFASAQLPLKGIRLTPCAFIRDLCVYSPLQIGNYFQLGFDKICLGFMATASALAYYTLSDRICLAFISLVNGVTGVLLPYLTKTFSKGEASSGNISALVRKNYLALSLYLPIAMLLIIGIDLTGQTWSVILFGKAFRDVGTILVVMKWNLIIYTLTRMLANMYFLPSGRQTMYMRSLLIGAVLQIICIPMGMHFGNILWACGGLALANTLVLSNMIWVGRVDMLPLLKLLVTSKDNIRRFIAGIIVYGAFIILPAPDTPRLLPELFYSLGIIFSYFVILFILRDSQLIGLIRKHFLSRVTLLNRLR